MTSSLAVKLSCVMTVSVRTSPLLVLVAVGVLRTLTSVGVATGCVAGTTVSVVTAFVATVVEGIIVETVVVIPEAWVVSFIPLGAKVTVGTLEQEATNVLSTHSAIKVNVPTLLIFIFIL